MLVKNVNVIYFEVDAQYDFNLPFSNSILPSIQVSAANAYILNQNVDKDTFNCQNRYLIRPIPTNN